MKNHFNQNWIQFKSKKTTEIIKLKQLIVDIRVDKKK